MLDRNDVLCPPVVYPPPERRPGPRSPLPPPPPPTPLPQVGLRHRPDEDASTRHRCHAASVSRLVPHFCARRPSELRRRLPIVMSTRNAGRSASECRRT